jgi:predicted nucleic acid-binding protein
VKEKSVSWLDSSALLALLLGEPGMELVQELLEQAERQRAMVFLSVITLTEIISSLIRTQGEGKARDELDVLLTLPVKMESPTRYQCAEAGSLRGRYKVSTADAIIGAQAMAAGAELVHKDPEFEAIAGLRQRRLPYKKKAGRG